LRRRVKNNYRSKAVPFPRLGGMALRDTPSACGGELHTKNYLIEWHF